MELSRSERISIRLTVFTQYQQVTDRETDGPTDEIVIHELMQTLRRTIKTSRADSALSTSLRRRVRPGDNALYWRRPSIYEAVKNSKDKLLSATY